jgi:hypothetical protein
MGIKVICVSLDKDLLQVPGYHYDFVKGIERYVSPLDGLRAFYGQVIQGDGSDNIPAYDGKFRQATPKFIQKLLDPLNDFSQEVEMYNYCKEVWNSEPVMELYAQCLWIQRKENDSWKPPVNSNQLT